MYFSTSNGCIKLSDDHEEGEVDDAANGANCLKTLIRTDEQNPSTENYYKKTENNKQTKKCARGHWRPSEDAKLMEVVAIYGPQNWNLIAQKLEGRSGKSCRLRWYNQLDPKINKRAFSEEEEKRLMEAHRVYGNKWALISRLFPGRTDNGVKNHWHVLMGRKYKEQQQSKPNYFKRQWTSFSTAHTCNGKTRLLMDQTTANCTGSEVQLPNQSGVRVLGSDYGQLIRGFSGVNLYSAGCEIRSWDHMMIRKEILDDDSRNRLSAGLISSYSTGSTSQISWGAPSPSPSAVEYQNSSHFIQTPAKPIFIDFLGVGAIYDHAK